MSPKAPSAAGISAMLPPLPHRGGDDDVMAFVPANYAYARARENVVEHVRGVFPNIFQSTTNFPHGMSCVYHYSGIEVANEADTLRVQLAQYRKFDHGELAYSPPERAHFAFANGHTIVSVHGTDFDTYIGYGVFIVHDDMFDAANTYTICRVLCIVD